jgi:DNA-binding NarL/FixJ family response regulator
MAGQELNKILVLDDSTSLTSPWKAEIGRYYKLLNCMGWFEAISKLRENPDIRVGIVNLSLKDINGLEAIRKIKDKNSSLPIIVLARMEDTRLVQNAREMGVKESCYQPVDIDSLLAKIKNFAPAAIPQAPVPEAPKPEKTEAREEADENNIKSRFYQAQSMFANGDLPGASKLFNEVANEKRLKDSYLKYAEEAGFQEGRCWLRMKDYPRAIDVFKNFLNRAPKSFFARQALFYMANSYEEMKDFNKALNFYAKVISLGGMDSLATQARKQMEKLK